MKRAIVYFLIIIPLASFGQDYDLPKMNHYTIHHYFYWTDTLIENQILFHKNNNKKIEYVQLDQNHKLRIEYWENGRKKAETVIYQIYRCDTSLLRDPDDPMIILDTIIDSGYLDVPDGKYIEYHKPHYSENDIPLTIGQFIDGHQTGVWETETVSPTYLTVATFNDFGILEGEYVKYYFSYPNMKENIKYKGQYASIRFKKSPWSGETFENPIYIPRRVGKWMFYSENGELIEVVEYPNRTHYNNK